MTIKSDSRWKIFTYCMMAGLFQNMSFLTDDGINENGPHVTTNFSINDAYQHWRLAVIGSIATHLYNYDKVMGFKLNAPEGTIKYTTTDDNKKTTTTEIPKNYFMENERLLEDALRQKLTFITNLDDAISTGDNNKIRSIVDTPEQYGETIERLKESIKVAINATKKTSNPKINALLAMVRKYKAEQAEHKVVASKAISKGLSNAAIKAKVIAEGKRLNGLGIKGDKRLLLLNKFRNSLAAAGGRTRRGRRSTRRNRRNTRRN